MYTVGRFAGLQMLITSKATALGHELGCWRIDVAINPVTARATCKHCGMSVIITLSSNEIATGEAITLTCTRS